MLSGSNPGICGMGKKARSGEIQILSQDRYILFFGECLFGGLGVDHLVCT